MRSVEAAADIGKSEISKQPLRHAVTFESGKSRVLRRDFRTVEESEASELQCVSLVACQIEFRVQLPWKDHRDVLTPVVRAEVIRSKSKRALVCARSGRSCGKTEHERHRELGIQ